MQQQALLDLLGARWALGAPVVAAAWNAAGAVAGFALADGTLALAPRSWPGAPRVAQRPTGGIELVPATAPPAPVVRSAVQDGGCTGLAAMPAEGGGFITIGHSGLLACTGADGTRCPLPAGLPEAATALAGDGAHLVIGHAGGIALAGGIRHLAGSMCPAMLACGGGVVAAWSDAGGLAVWPAPQAGAVTLPDCPGPPTGLTVFDRGRLLAIAGGTRPVYWVIAPEPDGPMAMGPTGRHLVSAVAGHPQRALLAVGYDHGVVLLCHPHADDMLFLRPPDDDRVTALAWSHDGRRLALGTQAGEIAVLALPAALFRQQEAA